MKIVIQKVLKASVKDVGKDIMVGQIERGLMVLVGIHRSDEAKQIDFLANKIVNCKLWDDEQGRTWRESAKQQKHKILLVSQFTLQGGFPKGNRPEFHRAMKNEAALDLFNQFVEKVKQLYVAKNERWNGAEDDVDEYIQIGAFGQQMEVSLVNDGPVTIVVDRLSPAAKQKALEDAQAEVEKLKTM